MLICNNCGRLIEDDELHYTTECHGYTSLGEAMREVIDTPCSCGGDFIKATKCAICGEWFNNEEIHGVCDSCISGHETVDEALAIGAENVVAVDINEFVTKVLTAEEINEILAKAVKEKVADHSHEVEKYCEDDLSYFAEFIEYKYGERG